MARQANLLLVSIDSLRADYAPVLGTRVSAPAFAAQARGFDIFSHCVSVASATRPVHASVFSGLYPFEHGVRGQRSASMRPAVADLLTTLAADNWRVFGRSEAASIFTGLPFASLIAPLPATPEAGLSQLFRLLRTTTGNRVLLFVHYWSTHTPYGASDERAFGIIGKLLAAGRVEEVKQRYTAAVRTVLEEKLAPLLSRLDRNRWAIVIFGDHGESWARDEPYHGQTLRNSVLHVPLYVSIPGRPPAPDTEALVSLIDVLPTLLEFLEVPFPNTLSGRSLFRKTPRGPCFAEIAPVSGNDLPSAQRDRDYGTESSGQPQWCMLDMDYKLTGYARTGRHLLQHTWSELPAHDSAAERRLLEAYRTLRSASPYASEHTASSVAIAPDPLLEQRLRDLGYLN